MLLGQRTSRGELNVDVVLVQASTTARKNASSHPKAMAPRKVVISAPTGNDLRPCLLRQLEDP